MAARGLPRRERSLGDRAESRWGELYTKGSLQHHNAQYHKTTITISHTRKLEEDSGASPTPDSTRGVGGLSTRKIDWQLI